MRVFGCELIQEAGILLKLYGAYVGPTRLILIADLSDPRPQVAMATGQTILHRFFLRASLKSHTVEVWNVTWIAC
jgi:hypothetical protein